MVIFDGNQPLGQVPGTSEEAIANFLKPTDRGAGMRNIGRIMPPDHVTVYHPEHDDYWLPWFQGDYEQKFVDGETRGLYTRLLYDLRDGTDPIS